MWRKTVFTFCALGAVLIFGQLVPTGPQVKALTATRTEAIFAADAPLPSLVQTRTIAVRSDGSIAVLLHLEDPAGSGRVVYRKKVTDVTAERHVVVEPLGESRVTYPLTAAAAVARAVKPSSSCGGDAAPTGKVLGYDAVVAEKTQPLRGSEEVKTKTWMAPGLDCFPLREEIYFFTEGKMTQRTVESVVNVVPGEPEAWIFQIPESYVERTPSEAMAEAARRHPERPGCTNWIANFQPETGSVKCQ